MIKKKPENSIFPYFLFKKLLVTGRQEYCWGVGELTEGCSGNSLRATASPVSSTRDVGSGRLGSITGAVIDLLCHFVQEASSARVCPPKANGWQ